MRNKPFIVLALAVVFLAHSDSILAHHARTIFDNHHPVTLTGTVTEFEFSNPHVRIHIDVKLENGNVVKWVAESAAPQALYRTGWTSDTLKPGDQITVTGFPYKDGTKIMSVEKLVGPGGKDLPVKV